MERFSGCGLEGHDCSAPSAASGQLPSVLPPVHRLPGRTSRHMGGCLEPLNAGPCVPQVLLLLQSSDRIAHDISEAHPACCRVHTGDGGGGSEASAGAGAAPSANGGPSNGGAGVPLTLALRQWRRLTPGREFRCFVAKKDLIGALHDRNNTTLW